MGWFVPKHITVACWKPTHFFCDFYILIYIEGLRASLKVINSPTLGLINIKPSFNAQCLSRLFMKS